MLCGSAALPVNVPFRLRLKYILKAHHRAFARNRALAAPQTAQALAQIGIQVEPSACLQFLTFMLKQHGSPNRPLSRITAKARRSQLLLPGHALMLCLSSRGPLHKIPFVSPNLPQT